MKSEAGEHTELQTHSITMLCIAIKPPSRILPVAGHDQQKRKRENTFGTLSRVFLIYESLNMKQLKFEICT